MQRQIATALMTVGCAILLFLSATTAFGQTITGTLLGTVLDASGAVVPGAQITVTNEGTGVSNKATSSPQGFYNLPNLAPGRYTVTVEAPGFKKFISTGNIVQVEQTTRVDMALSVGQVAQEVHVSGQTPLVESTTSDIGSEIEQKQINNLPLNARLFQTLLFLTPGATPSAWGDQDENPAASGSTAATGAGTGTYASVNGFAFQGNLFLVDGIHNVEPQNAYISIAIPFAAIQDMKLETSNPSAEYGTFGGAVVNLTTKSGTNEFHGELFDYIRNDAFNARDYFALKRAPFKSNQFGGALGGPIIRNKLFFFMDFQGLLQHVGQTYNVSVPTARMRTGDLSEVGASPVTNLKACALIAAANGVAAPQSCTATSVPKADISPIAAALLSPSIVPLPNLPGISNNFVTNAVNTETVPQFDVRVDYAFSQRDRFFVRESYLHRDFTSPSPGTVFLVGGPYATNANHNAVVSWDHFFSSNVINQLRFGYNRYSTADFVNAFGIEQNNALGIPNGNLPGLPITSGIAAFTINGGFGYSGNKLVGDTGPVPNGLGRLANIFEVADNVSLVHGRHALKFGGNVERLQTSVRNPQNDPRGLFDFGGGYTGYGFSDFLVGGPDQANRDLFPSTPATRVTFFGIYGQDDFRISNKLTLNLGLRYDIYTAPVDAANRQSNFVTTGPNAGLIQIASSSNRGPNVDTYFGNVGPRLGVAFTPDGGKTAFRAAWGLSYFPDNFGADGGTLERNYPETLIQNNSGFSSSCSTTITPTAKYSGCGSLILANGLPGVTPAQVYSPLVVPPLTPGGFVNPPVGFGVFSIARNFRQDKAQAWNVSIERQLGSTMFFRAAYVGTAGDHLYHDYQLNQCDPTITTAPYPGCLPFHSINPNITTVDFRNSGGTSRYQSGQFQLQKRTSVGLSFMASYTWSKLLDNIANPISPYQTRLELVAPGFQRSNYPHNGVISYTYDLPFGQGRRWFNSGSTIANVLAGGWGINGITTFRSGGPLLVQAPKSLLPPQADQERANYICSGTQYPHTVAKWFDTSCFTQPAKGTFGDASPGNVYGPGLQNWDVALVKQVSLGESRQLRLEASYFNFFNHANFQNPDVNVQDSNFGKISSDVGNPRSLQLGLKFAF